MHSKYFQIKTLSFLFLVSCGYGKNKSPSQLTALHYGQQPTSSSFETYSDLLDEQERRLDEAIAKSTPLNLAFLLDLHQEIKRWSAQSTADEREDSLKILKRSSGIIKKIVTSRQYTKSPKPFDSSEMYDRIKTLVALLKDSGTLFLNDGENSEFAIEVLETLKEWNANHTIQNSRNSVFSFYPFYTFLLEQAMDNKKGINPQFLLTLLLHTLKPILEPLHLSLEFELLNTYLHAGDTSVQLREMERLIAIFYRVLSGDPSPSVGDSNVRTAELKSFVNFLDQNKAALNSLTQEALASLLPDSFLRAQYDFVFNTLKNLQAQLEALDTPQLTAHLTYDRLQMALKTLRDYKKESQDERDKFIQHKKEASHIASNQIKENLHLNQIKVEDDFLRHEIYNQRSLVQSLKSKIAFEDTHFAQFYNQFAMYFANQNWLQNHGKGLSLTSQNTYVVSAQDGKALSEEQRQHSSRSVLDLAMSRNGKVVRLELQPFETLTTHVTGEWKANGLIKLYMPHDERLGSLKGKVDFISFGPEGFPENMVMGFSSYKSNDHSVSDYTRKESTTSDTTSFGVDAGFGYTPEPGFGTSGKMTASQSHSQTHSTTTGREDRKTRSQGTRSDVSHHYSIQGLRLAHAPIPFMPVGSLVKVVLPKGETDLKDALHIDIVRRNDVYFAEKDVDIYFVVNDFGGDFSTHLNLNVQVFQTHDDQLKSFQKDLFQILQQVKNKKAEIFNSGHFSPQMSLEMKQDALAKLTLLPAFSSPIVQQYAHKWLEKELSFLEHCSQIRKAEASLNYAIARQKSLESSGEMQSRILNIGHNVFLEDIQNLDQAPLVSSLRKMVRHQAHVVLPMLQILNPTVLDELRFKLKKRSFDLTTPLTTQATTLIEMAEEVLKVVEDHAFDETEEVKGNIVALAFPMNKDSSVEAQYWTSAPEWLSAQVWQAIGNVYTGTGSTVVQIDITPDILFAGDLGRMRELNTPLVTKMGIGIIGRNSRDKDMEVFNDGQLNIKVTRGPKYTMPSSLTGLELSYFKSQQDVVTLPIVLGSSTNARRAVLSILPQSSAQGESPFTTYSIDFNQLKSVASFHQEITQAHNFVIFFEMTSKSHKK